MIGYYQALIAQEKARIRRFVNLSNSLNGSVVPALTATENDLIKASTSLKNSFTIDGNGADNESIKNNANNVSNVISQISGPVASAITSEIGVSNARIAEYNARIQEILAAEEAERQAAIANYGKNNK